MRDGTTAGDSAAAVRRVVPGADGRGRERRVSTDQANLSVAVDERWLVKWLRTPLAPADLVILERLREVGFAHMPAYAGALVEDGVVRALVHELVVGATDGWQWYVDDVLAWLDGAMGMEPLVATAASMGTVTAELHHALAPAHEVRAPITDLRTRIESLRATAFAATDGEAGERLRARRDRIDAALAPLADVGEVVVQAIHGDLHAGQFLRSPAEPARLLLTDFDGDPMVSSGARAVRQPVERDVAGLVQSIDHVGRVAARHRPAADVEPFIDAATDACLDAYRASHRLDEDLLRPLRVAQELHEYTYAATRLPVWLYVPDAALRRLLP